MATGPVDGGPDEGTADATPGVVGVHGETLEVGDPSHLPDDGEAHRDAGDLDDEHHRVRGGGHGIGPTGLADPPHRVESAIVDHRQGGRIGRRVHRHAVEGR